MAAAQRKRGISLAGGLLATAAIAELIAPAQPAALNDGMRLFDFLLMLMIGGVPGGMLAMILALYCAETWQIVVAGYCVGSVATVVAVRVLMFGHDTGLALAGAALLVAFALLVRAGQRESGVRVDR